MMFFSPNLLPCNATNSHRVVKGLAFNGAGDYFSQNNMLDKSGRWRGVGVRMCRAPRKREMGQM